MAFTTLVIATKNVHKISEFKEILKDLNLDIISLFNFPDYIPNEETKATFEENAIDKAMSAAKKLNQLVLADDSGLCVPALHDSPGIFSARYAGNNASDKENRKKLLTNMLSLKDNARNAFFTCSLALASPCGLIKSVSATCEGFISEIEHGSDGFGYDPIFIKHEYNQTFAQLSSCIKNKISHRRKALDKILNTLKTVI